MRGKNNFYFAIVVVLCLVFGSRVQARTTTKEVMTAALEEYETQTKSTLTTLRPGGDIEAKEVLAYRYGYALAFRAGYYGYPQCATLAEDELYGTAITRGCQDHYDALIPDFVTMTACGQAKTCTLSETQQEVVGRMIDDLDQFCLKQLGDCRYFWPVMAKNTELKELYEALLASGKNNIDKRAYQEKLAKIMAGTLTLKPKVSDQKTVDQEAALKALQQLGQQTTQQ